MGENNYGGELAREEIASNIKAEYDEKYILKSLLLGKTRDDLAEEFNHKSYRTLDMYMRRRGFIWDSNKQNYVPKPSEVIVKDFTPTTSKVDRIISLFEAGLDPREIAKKIGMKDHRNMAMYMKDKGYIWSSEMQNYVLFRGEQKFSNIDDTNFENNIDDISISTPSLEDEIPQEALPFNKISSKTELEHLLPMLDMLNRHKEKLAELLSISEGSTIPRYIVGGITITKSLCMSHNLSQLIKEFSKERNISQREIFEVAIIEFLRKYGYENEIKALFG